MLCAGDRSAAAKAGTEPARLARPETEATGWASGRGWEAYETIRRRLRTHRAGRSATSRVFGEERTQHGAGAVRNDQSGRSRSWRGGISMDCAPFFEGTSGTEGGAEHQLTDGISRIRAGRRAAKPGYRPRTGARPSLPENGIAKLCRRERRTGNGPAVTFLKMSNSV